MDSPTKQYLWNIFVKKFWFNGKGILVPVLFIISLFLVCGIAILLEPYPFIPDKGPVANAFFVGLILSFGGSATWFVGRDFISKDGKRIETDLDNRFLFIKMKVLGKISFAAGVFLLCYAMYLKLIA